MASLTVQQACDLLEDVDEWFDFQVSAFEYWQGERFDQDGTPLDKMCVYHPTGKGKSSTMLTCLAIRGVMECVVLAPPITHKKWIETGRQLGMVVHPMSHAKFRMADTKLDRNMAIIIDEFHLLGGHNGKGWKKADRMAAGLKAPLILGSATPNYNDAERVYCIAHILDPFGNRGGYLSWLYKHCTTEQNPHGAEPIVTGFDSYASAEEFLASMPGVVYLPDEAPDIIKDVPMGFILPDVFEKYGLDRSRERIMASMMERTHRSRYLQAVDPVNGRLRPHVYTSLMTRVQQAGTPVMVFSNHSTIATALANSLADHAVPFGYVDGDTSFKAKNEEMEAFIAGQYDVLVGTASIATGADGIDRMCDVMVILDDTTDPSLRRQLVGRVLPRGANADYANKVAWRFTYYD